MKIESIKYEQLLPTGSYLNARYGIEISISEDNETDRAFELAKQIVAETHKKQFPAMYEQGKPIYGGEENMPVVQHKSPLDQFEEDFRFNDVKKRLAEIEFFEEAQAYLETTEYKYTIEAKKLIENKPKKQ